MANRLKRFFDAVFMTDALKADTTATSISTRTGTVLIFLRSFSAAFIIDTLRAVFTAINTKNNIDLGFLSTFMLRRDAIKGLKSKADYKNMFNL